MLFMVKKVFKMIMSLFNQVSLSTKDVQVIKKNIIYIMNFLMIFIKKKKKRLTISKIKKIIFHIIKKDFSTLIFILKQFSSLKSRLYIIFPYFCMFN